MKKLKTLGLIMFILGFGIFNIAFFLNKFTLQESTINAFVDNDVIQDKFKANSQAIISKVYTGNFLFIKDIRSVIEQVNDEIFTQYEITDEDIHYIIQAFKNDGTYQVNWDSLDNGEFGELIPELDFKLNTIGEFGEYLSDSEYQNREDLQNDLDKLAQTIRKYGILNKKGIDRYYARDIVYNLAKASNIGPVKTHPIRFLILTYIACIAGGLLYFIPKQKERPPGINNNGVFHNAMKNAGWLGILTGTYLIVFYILLYFFPEYMTGWIIMVDPVSIFIKGEGAGRFFLYGFLYTLVILVMGVRMLIHYRHSRYQILRTISVMFFQTCFAFIIPEILLRLNKPYFDFKNIWPLDYDFFFDYELNNLISSGGLGIFMLVWGIALIVIAVPVLVYFYGKRWYCSWVCGCGGLAETLGDPYRQLSNKSLKAWKIERYLIHGVLAFAIIMTAGVLYTFFTGQGSILGLNTYTIREIYGVYIGAGFAGVVGTGFYPLMGNRVWCRFGCPLAAYLGIIQRFKSRFRITTNGGQCISCGNCSTYCEMGIDVRWYAQRGQNIIRSSCVGCGICSAVCPRGVLKLENSHEKGRFGKPILIGNDSLKITK